jgi:hypothetical protein
VNYWRSTEREAGNYVKLRCMDTKVDLSAASGEALLDIIDQQQAVIDQLQRRIEVLEGKAKPGGPTGMPGNKPKSGRRPEEEKGSRKPRSQGLARHRMTPTHRVEHVLETCPDCGTGQAGGWVQRSREVREVREVIDIPLVPVQAFAPSNGTSRQYTSCT